jgi:hypothetical protein
MEDQSLSVFDTTPGGNGLSHTALLGTRVPSALDECIQTIDGLNRKGRKRFTDYIEQMLNLEVSGDTFSRVRDVIDTLRHRWNG